MAALNKVEKIIKIFYTKGGHVERADIQLACDILNNSGVIAVPTDTLYGIAARVDDSKALDKIYKIKNRDISKPLAVCVSRFDQIEHVADITKFDKTLLGSLLPGPLTVVLKRSSSLNKDLNPNIANIGVRIPSHNFVRAISEELDCPLALTSANKSGDTSPLVIEDFQDIWDDLDVIFDLGPLRASLPVLDSKLIHRLRAGSTVVDLTEDKTYKILREGCAYLRTISVLRRFGLKSRN